MLKKNNQHAFKIRSQKSEHEASTKKSKRDKPVSEKTAKARKLNADIADRALNKELLEINKDLYSFD
jgi:hypothetical protein